MKPEPRLRTPRPSLARRMVTQPDDPWQDVAAVAVAIVLLFCICIMAGALPPVPR